MFIVVTEPCCERAPFEEHKENCYFKQQQRTMAKIIKKLLKEFEQALKE
jgi:hypothetical protein